MNNENEQLIESLVSIVSELFRFKHVFQKAVSKLNEEEREKYMSQYAWLDKRVTKAIDAAGLHTINLEGQLYDPGMAVVPLNIEEFEINDALFVSQMLEPIIMQDHCVIKTGTVMLGRVEA
ncbi:MAG: hypothetical protein RSE18_08280 [Acinetobacter sp.]